MSVSVEFNQTASNIIALTSAILSLIAYWKIFVKMGEPGWKAIIPIYSSYTLYKKIWNIKWFVITLIVEIVLVITGSCIPVLAMTSDKNAIIPAIIFVILIIAAIVLTVMMCSKLSRAFGHGAGFTAGLFFLMPIFLLILAFSSDQYQKS